MIDIWLFYGSMAVWLCDCFLSMHSGRVIYSNRYKTFNSKLLEVLQDTVRKDGKLCTPRRYSLCTGNYISHPELY